MNLMIWMSIKEGMRSCETKIQQNNSSLQNPGYETLDLDDLEREARIRKVMEDDEGEEDEE